MDIGSRPGWFADPVGTGGLRWWTGMSWSPIAADSSGVDLSRPDVHGLVWAWHPAPRWPAAPPHWFPPPGWGAPNQLEPPPSNWAWWDFSLRMEADGYRPTSRGLSEDDHPDRLSELVAEERADPWFWGEVDLTRVPVTWTPPPNWPPTEPGWSPPRGWKAPRRWGSAPPEWDFWQPDRRIIAARQKEAETRLETHSQRLLNTAGGILMTLIKCEAMVALSTTTTPLIKSPLPTGARMGITNSPETPEIIALDSAQQWVIHAASALKTYALHVRFGIREVDHWAGELRLDTVRAWAAYERSAGAAVQTYCERTIARFKEETTKLTSSRNKNRKQLAFEAISRLDKFQVEMLARMAAVQSHATRDEASDIAKGKLVSWQRAEHAALDAMRRMGFTDAELTESGTDSGIDVKSAQAVAQVKDWSKPVGRPDIQKLVGANLHWTYSLFFSSSGYTPMATDYADQAGVGLFILNMTTGEAAPANRTAEALSDL